jgi:hypothetical protein
VLDQRQNYKVTAQQVAVGGQPVQLQRKEMKLQSFCPELQEEFLARSLCLIHSLLTHCKKTVSFIQQENCFMARVRYKSLKFNYRYFSCILHVLL